MNHRVGTDDGHPPTNNAVASIVIALPPSINLRRDSLTRIPLASAVNEALDANLSVHIIGTHH